MGHTPFLSLASAMLAAADVGSLYLIGGLLLVAAVVAGGLVFWRRRWKQAVNARFAQYRERVVQLSETLDALKERHKLLPYTDSDFAEPMAGQTEALYRTAHQALEEARGRWLRLMDAWERAQALVAEESWLGAAKYREAERLIRAAAVEQEHEAVRQRCADPLDRLERAHAQAQEELTTADQHARQLPARLADIEKAGLATAPYPPELHAFTALVEQARGLCRNDPIGALELLHQFRERAGAWTQWIDAILELRRKAEQALEAMEKASSAMNARRAEGFRFCEPSCDPKPLLDDAWRRREAALEALNAGQAPLAAEALTAALQATDQAKETIERTVKAKARCEAAFAQRGSESRRWEDALRLCRQRHMELEREFAADSWRDVGAHLHNAASLLAGADAAIGEAATLAVPQMQHFVRAAALLDQADQRRGEAQTLCGAVERRLNELVEQRRRCRDALDALRRRVDALTDTLRQSTADRAQANERCREAARLLADAREAAERPRADWPRLETRIADIAKIAEEAERLTQDDFRLAQQAQDAMAKAQREFRQAQAFSRLGIAANLAESQRSFDEANRCLRNLEYEEAIRHAGRAEQEARQALADAERRANERQAQLDQERRQREAQAAAAIAPLASPPAEAPIEPSGPSFPSPP